MAGAVRRLRRLLAAGTALAVTGAVLAGGPALLLALGGDPLPRRLPTLDDVVGVLTGVDADGRVLLGVLVVVGWLAWAALAGCLLLEWGAVLAGRRAPRVPGLGAPQRWAGLLVAAALAGLAPVSPASAAFLEAPAAAASAAPPDAPGDPARPEAPGDPAPAGTPTASVPAGQPEPLVHEVARGDWMWHIAGRYLGDEERYPEIAALNPEYADRYPGYPDHIEPGDRLVLPDAARDRGPRPHATGGVTGGAAGAEPAPPAGSPVAGSPPPGVAPPATLDQGDPSRGVEPPATPDPVSPRAPATTPGPPAPAAGAVAGDADADRPGAVPLAPLAAGGMLAAVLLAAVALGRRRRMAHRRYGHSVADPAGAPAEVSLRAAADADVDRLDRALRHLAAAGVAADVGAVWATGGDIHLIMATPGSPPPAPFRADHAGDWLLPATADLPDPAGAPSPLPALATVGSAPGRHLLVDLERLGVLTVTGDEQRCGDLLRHLVAELAHNPWSDLTEVWLAGFPPGQARTLAGLNPERVRVVESLPEAVATARRRLAHTNRALERHGLAGTLHGRVGDTATDSWGPWLLVVSADSAREPAGDRSLADLRAAIAAAGRRRGVALVAAGGPGATDRGDAGRSVLTIAPDGTLSAGFLDGGATVPAAGLPVRLLDAYVDLVRTATSGDDVPVRSGADHDAGRPDTGAGASDEPACEEADAPSVEILGPVRVTGSGPPPARRIRLCRELVVYLAARGRRGATAAEIEADLWPGRRVPPTVRTEVLAATRRWLGEAADGGPWLPEAGADGRYRLRHGVQVDWDLFRCRRSRAHRRGRAGAADLRTALALVRGEPLDGCGPPAASGGVREGVRVAYSWLAGSRFDPQRVVAGVVDAAHDLVESCLRAGDLDLARWAVERAWLADAARSDDHPWRDLLRVTYAAGDRDQVRAVVADLLRWRDADHPDELSRPTRDLVVSLSPPGSG